MAARTYVCCKACAEELGAAALSECNALVIWSAAGAAAISPSLSGQSSGGNESVNNARIVPFAQVACQARQIFFAIWNVVGLSVYMDVSATDAAKPFPFFVSVGLRLWLVSTYFIPMFII
eukprot:6189807-Pleurochrysis_carterae.AAC.3